MYYQNMIWSPSPIFTMSVSVQWALLTHLMLQLVGNVELFHEGFIDWQHTAGLSLRRCCGVFVIENTPVYVSSCRHLKDLGFSSAALSLTPSLLHSASNHSPLFHLLSSTFLFSLTCSPSLKGFHSLSLNHFSISFHIPPPPPRSPLPCTSLQRIAPT